jgi:septum site-determining protein MinD
LAKIISVHSFRGGTGKSNTTASLAALIAGAGKRVGIVDTDVQSPGIHVLFQFDLCNTDHCLNDFLWGKCRIEQAAHDVTDRVFAESLPDEGTGPRLFLIPSSVRSGEIGRVLREGLDVALLNDGFQQLIHALNLDVLFIDTHPGVNEETLLSIAVSDLLLLVLRPDNQDFQGTAVTVELARRLDVNDMLLLVNKVPPGMDYDALREKVEATYRAEVAAILPLNHEIVNLASGGIFARRYPEHPFSRELSILAKRLIGASAGVGPASCP